MARGLGLVGSPGLARLSRQALPKFMYVVSNSPSWCTDGTCTLTVGIYRVSASDPDSPEAYFYLVIVPVGKIWLVGNHSGWWVGSS